MKLLTSTISLLSILLLSSVLIAQTDDWKTLSPAEEEFSLRIPTRFYREVKTSYNEEKYVHNQYRSFLKNTYFVITTNKYDKIGITDAIKDVAEKHNSTKEKITFGQIAGNVYKFTDFDGFQHLAITLSTTKRRYVFHIFGKVLDQENVNKFLKSISFQESAKNGNPPKTPIFENLQIDIEDSEKNIGSNSGFLGSPRFIDNQNKVGFGVGSGIGNGSSSVNRDVSRSVVPKPTQKPKNSGVKTPLKILSKQKPSYTELARIYLISGKVRVRILFLSTGKIGSVSVVKALPLGLTERAILAARQIKFEPPTSDGVPYSIKKTVVYNFNVF